MTHTIEIESIARLDIKPGETLVVTLPRPVTREMIQDVKETVMANLPEGVHVLVKSGDIKLHVVALEDA